MKRIVIIIVMIQAIKKILSIHQHVLHHVPLKASKRVKKIFFQQKSLVKALSKMAQHEEKVQSDKFADDS